MALSSDVKHLLMKIETNEAQYKSSRPAYDDDDYDDETYDEYEDVETPDKKTKPSSHGGSRDRRSIGKQYRVYLAKEPNKRYEPKEVEVQSRIFIEKGGDYQFVKSPPTGVVKAHDVDKPIRHHAHNIRSKSKSDSDVIAVQYGGDSSSYKGTGATHYDRNHRMYHPKGIFKDWRPSPWVGELEADNNFIMTHGQVTVEQSGLYYVYAQVFYADKHDTSGFRIYKNDAAEFQCTVTSLGDGENHGHLRRNSCYTGGLVWLDTGDKVSLKEVEGERYTVFEPTKSFFGLFKVSCCSK